MSLNELGARSRGLKHTAGSAVNDGRHVLRFAEVGLNAPGAFRSGRNLFATQMIVREIKTNGLTLVTEAMPHVRSVAIGVWLKRGSRHETAGQAGISHFIEHMVFKGTRNRSAETIASEVDSIGGHMDAFTAKEYDSFHLKVLDEHLPIAVEILGDTVLNPLFDPVDRVKATKDT